MNDLHSAKILVTLFLCGDFMSGRGIDQALPHSVSPQLYESYVRDARQYVQLAEEMNGPLPRTVSYEYVWGDALEELRRRRPDVRVINLETSVTVNDDYWPGKEIHYRMHPGNVELLTVAGVDGCVLANNHVLDWGRCGLMESLQVLREAGVSTTGAGENLERASAPAMFSREGGKRVAVFSYASWDSGVPAAWAAAAGEAGVNFLADWSAASADRVIADVEKHADRGDIVIVSVHWGANWGYEIPVEHETFAHRLVDSGLVDLVHGHSSHHPKGIEVYRQKLILYGSGDFLNDYEGIRGHEWFRPDLVLMYFPALDAATGDLVRLEMVPLQVRKFRLNRASTADARWLVERMNRASERYGLETRLSPQETLRAAWPGSEEQSRTK